jgi:hypothetical protein
MALVRLNHPTNDPALPSFVHPLLLEAMDDLEIVLDCWNGLKGAKKKYLPKESREPKTAYEGRLMRSSFNSFFRDAINAFAGVLSRYELNDAPASFQQHLNNIDGQGNSLRSFLMKSDIWTMRDGGSLLLADMPPAPREGETRADTKDRRPYLSIVDRRNLVNWDPLPGGQARSLSILEVQERPVGEYGVEYVPRFRVMRGAMWAVYDVTGEGPNWTATVAQYPDGTPMSGTFRTSSGDELLAPPVRWYSGTNDGFGQGDIGLLPLANYALDHLREYSDLKELLHKTAIPVPVREGVLGTGPGGTTPPMVLGSNSGIDLPAGGKFSFAEVTGAALGKHEEHLVHIEGLIDRKTLSFLFSGAQKTATQANLESVQMQATLQSIGEAKVSVVQSLMELWCQFSGETLKPTAGIELAEGIFDEPLTTEKLGLAEKLYNSSLLSRKTMIYLEQKHGLLQPGHTPDDEIKEIEKEEPKALPPADPNSAEDGLPFEEPAPLPPPAVEPAAA